MNKETFENIKSNILQEIEDMKEDIINKKEQIEELTIELDNNRNNDMRIEDDENYKLYKKIQIEIESIGDNINILNNENKNDEIEIKEQNKMIVGLDKKEPE